MRPWDGKQTAILPAVAAAPATAARRVPPLSRTHEYAAAPVAAAVALPRPPLPTDRCRVRRCHRWTGARQSGRLDGWWDGGWVATVYATERNDSLHPPRRHRAIRPPGPSLSPAAPPLSLARPIPRRSGGHGHGRERAASGKRQAASGKRQAADRLPVSPPPTAPRPTLHRSTAL